MLLTSLKQAIRRLVGIRTETDFFSQAGEDAILMNTFLYLLKIEKGIYVDIGAYHPFKHSNTLLLYKAGWRGVNIDPRPGSKKLFDKHRSADVNIEAGVDVKNGELTYYFISDTSTMNTFSRENLDRLGMFGEVKKEFKVPVLSLKSLMEKHPVINRADYLNIDAEGFELRILQGIDFSLMSPSVVSIEQNYVLTLEDVLKTKTASFLSEKGYVPFAKNLILGDVATVFYLRKDKIDPIFHGGQNVS
jgi:FkbM family methyltransferase